jgi:hypothetical protein
VTDPGGPYKPHSVEDTAEVAGRQDGFAIVAGQGGVQYSEGRASGGGPQLTPTPLRLTACGESLVLSVMTIMAFIWSMCWLPVLVITTFWMAPACRIRLCRSWLQTGEQFNLFLVAE